MFRRTLVTARKLSRPTNSAIRNQELTNSIVDKLHKNNIEILALLTKEKKQESTWDKMKPGFFNGLILGSPVAAYCLYDDYKNSVENIKTARLRKENASKRLVSIVTELVQTPQYLSRWDSISGKVNPEYFKLMEDLRQANRHYLDAIIIPYQGYEKADTTVFKLYKKSLLRELIDTDVRENTTIEFEAILKPLKTSPNKELNAKYKQYMDVVKAKATELHESKARADKHMQWLEPRDEDIEDNMIFSLATTLKTVGDKDKENTTEALPKMQNSK